MLRKFERFDIFVGVIAIGLITLLGVVVAHGDQVGLGIDSYTPRQNASSHTTLQITFSENVNLAEIEKYLSIQPSIPGKVSVSGQQVIFQPEKSLPLGQLYTVTLRAGLSAISGRLLKRDMQWQFNIRSPLVVYLAPSDPQNKVIENLYAVDPANPLHPQQITSSTSGVTSYSVAPDGSQIVYAQLAIQRASNLWLWDAATDQSSLLYECPDAECANPTWRPDGKVIVFEQTDLNTGTGILPGVPRIWLLDVAQRSATPLFKDRQALGFSPQWAADGTKIAVFNVNEEGIVVHDFVSNQDHVIKTMQNQLGTFSPDGRWLYFPHLVDEQGGSGIIHLVLADVSAVPFVQHDLVPNNEPYSDTNATWMADSKSLIVARRAPASANAVQGDQLYQVDVATGQATPLIVDKNYTNGTVLLSLAGDAIVVQRFPLTAQVGSRPQLWMYNLLTHDLKQIVSDGRAPQWMP